MLEDIILLYILFAIITLQIVNNGNILTDGRDERDYRRRERIC